MVQRVRTRTRWSAGRLTASLGGTGVAETTSTFAVNDIVFADDEGDQQHDLSQYYATSIPAGHEVTDIQLAQASAALPAGVSINVANESLDFDDSAGSEGIVNGVILEVTTTPTDESDWLQRSADAIVAEDFRNYATRGQWMTKLQQDHGDGGGVHFAYTGVPFDGGVDGNYADPVPGGTLEKLGFDTNIFLTGGKSAYHRLYASEGATEAGPVWELKFPTPLSEFYYQFAVYIDPAIIGHNFGPDDMKFCFLNHLAFESGQIVAMLRAQGGQRIPKMFRVTSSATQVVNATSAPPLPTGGSPGLNGDHAYYPMLDLNPAAGQSYSSILDWGQRHGFRRRNATAELDDPNYDSMFRFEGGKWYHVQFYVNYTFAGASSNGILKMWVGERWQAPQLLIGAMIDASLNNSLTSKSIRMIMRPEDSVNAPPAGANGNGLRFDQHIVKDVPILHPGGFSIPFPGTEVPTGYPYLGQTESS